MANEEHLALLKKDVILWNSWRFRNHNTKIDLSDADLRKADLSKADLSYANLSNAALSRADLRGTDFNLANLERADLNRADLRGTNLSGADLSGAYLGKADLSGANLSKADLSEATLSSANIKGAYFTQATFYKTHMKSLRNATTAYGFETTVYKKDSIFDDGFVTVGRNWIEKYFGWDDLRKVGRLPLFAASYLTLIFIPLFYYGLAFYNNKIDGLRIWATTVANTDINYDIARFIVETLHKQPIPSQSFNFVISTAVLAIAATIYALFCPSRIQEFTEDVWTHQLGHPLVHYWPLAWKHRTLRILCVLCYAVGGTGVLAVIFTKVFRSAVFIWNNTSVSFF